MASEESLSERFSGMMNDRVIPEIGAELKRLGVQGSMELASALFNGSGFVPYGPGQYTPPVSDHAQEHEPALEPQQEEQHRGRSM